MAKIEGSIDGRFAAVGDVARDLLDSGTDTGLSVCVISEGQTVVDLWGGWADEAQSVRWNEDTITNVWSTTKTMTSLCALLLIERGLLDPEEPVARYWPEFAQGGKEDVRVKHLLSHTSGLSGWQEPVAFTDLSDTERLTSYLARQEPWWQPGAASGYHAFTFGHLIGELVRRTTGRSLGRFFADEFAAPLQSDFHIGLSESEFGRVANVFAQAPPPFPTGLAADSVHVRTMSSPVPALEEAWTRAWRTAEIGAANGHGNARSVARAQAVLSNGGSFNGNRLLSDYVLNLVFEPQSDGTDLVLLMNVRFGLGYCLGSDATPYIPTGRVCFWGGAGGSLVVNDADRGLTISFVMNKMAPTALGSPSSQAVVEAAYACCD